MYKTKLQELCHKRKWQLPVYTTTSTVKKGPRYTAVVSVHDQVFETPEEFKTIKEAHNTAARIAFDHFSVPPPPVVAAEPPIIQLTAVVNSQFQTAVPPSVFDRISPVAKVACPNAYKNRLREFAQKNGLECPSYQTVSLGMPHKPTFVSTVAIGTDAFKGDEAKNKKQAEMNAAKVAYSALTSGDAVTDSSMVSTINGCPVADNTLQGIQSIATIRKHHDTTSEGPDLCAKRAKTSPETIAYQPWKHWKTVVIPRELDKEATKHLC